MMVTLLAGCSLVPDYIRPDVDTRAGWSTHETSDETAIARDWWKNFDDAQLNALMASALTNNNDLRAGIQRVEQSRASAKIAGAALLPTIDSSAGASRTRTNPASGKTSNNTNLNAGLDIAYELDLFGKNRAGIEAAEASFQATQYDTDALGLVVMSDVATNYFALLNLRERLAITDQNLTNTKETLRIVAARVREGSESDIELAQQQASVSAAEASRAALVEQIANRENALAVLLGQAPQSLHVSGNNISGITIPEIIPAQPSTLLQRRPDVRAAEQSLIAANANIGAARAAFFPSVNLGAGASASLTGFGDPATTVLSLVSALSAPIFQGGRLEGGLEQATARQKELVETYKKTVLTSFQEVEDALAAVKAASDREAALQTAAQNAKTAYTLSQKRYDAGLIDFNTVLDTQNASLSADDNFAQAKLARLNAAILLYKALGGGWSS